jgi:hypothetical protein
MLARKASKVHIYSAIFLTELFTIVRNSFFRL